jgi:[ribosomal protein S18]-alanine N-acetyltransferase
MSARLDLRLHYRRMLPADLDGVMAIEHEIYPYPWTRGNFSDSIEAGYQCWIVEQGASIVGYCVTMLAAGEAHLLNLSIAAAWQRRGLGTELLGFVARLARSHGAPRIFLEVRRTNAAARALYAHCGFREIGVRHGYYPAGDAREDALVLELRLGVPGDG